MVTRGGVGSVQFHRGLIVMHHDRDLHREALRPDQSGWSDLHQTSGKYAGVMRSWATSGA